MKRVKISLPSPSIPRADPHPRIVRAETPNEHHRPAQRKIHEPWSLAHKKSPVPILIHHIPQALKLFLKIDPERLARCSRLLDLDEGPTVQALKFCPEHLPVRFELGCQVRGDCHLGDHAQDAHHVHLVELYLRFKRARREQRAVRRRSRICTLDVLDDWSGVGECDMASGIGAVNERRECVVRATVRLPAGRPDPKRPARRLDLRR